MEPQDVLADDMHIGGPQSAELLALLPVRLVGIIPDGGDIVDQRIQPDVGHVAGVEGHGDSPRKGGTGHAQILQSCLEEIVDHFLLAALRLDEVRMLIKVGHESVGVPAHAEEVRLLAGALDGSAAVGASAVRRLRIGEEGFARLAVPALVAGFIDVALVIKALEQLLHGGNMAAVGRADKTVVGNVHPVPQSLDPAGGVVHKRLRCHASRRRLVLDLLPVLIGTGAEKHIVAHFPLEAGNGIRHNRLVGVAEVRLAGGVRDGGGQIKCGLCHGVSLPFFVGIYGSLMYTYAGIARSLPIRSAMLPS